MTDTSERTTMPMITEEYIWRLRDSTLSGVVETGDAAEALWDDYRPREGSTHREIPQDVKEVGFVALDGTVEVISTDILSALHINPQWQNEGTNAAPVLWLRIGDSVKEAEQKLGKWRSFSLLTNDVFVTRVETGL